MARYLNFAYNFKYMKDVLIYMLIENISIVIFMKHNIY